MHQQNHCLALSLAIRTLQQRVKGESVTHGGGKTIELLCNESWWINMGYIEA